MRPIVYEHPNLAVGRILSYCPSLTGATGTRAYDLSGYDKHGNITNADLSVFHTRSEGRGAFKFDGVNDGISTNNVMSEIVKTDAFTWSGWFNTSSTTHYQSLVTCENGTDRFLNIYLARSLTEWVIAYRRSSGYFVTMPARTLNKWHHFAFVWSPTNGTGFTYLDGIRGDNVPGGPYFVERPFDIGINGYSGPTHDATPLNGMQDDINVYNRPLSAGEVKLLASQRGVSHLTRQRRTLAVTASIDRTETHTLGLADDATFTLPVRKTASDTLALTSDATFAVDMFGTFVTAESTLTLTQAASFFLLAEAYPSSQTLDLIDTVVVRGYVYGEGVLSLLDAATFRIGIPAAGYFITDTLAFVESIPRTQGYFISDAITFVSTGARITPATSSITFSQLVRVGKGIRVSSPITFGQTISTESRYRRSVSHSAILSHAVTYYSTDTCTKSRYTRFEGSGTSVGLPEKPRASESSPVSFESMTGAHATVFVRAPDMDDKHRLSFERVNRETRGGELNVYRDDAWTSTQSMLFTIVGIKTTIFDSLQAFIYATLGQEILFNDWTGVTWRGVLTNPDEAGTEDQDGYWTLAFEFEGEPYAGPPAIQNMLLAQTASFTIGV